MTAAEEEGSVVVDQEKVGRMPSSVSYWPDLTLVSYCTDLTPVSYCPDFRLPSYCPDFTPVSNPPDLRVTSYCPDLMLLAYWLDFTPVSYWPDFRVMSYWLDFTPVSKSDVRPVSNRPEASMVWKPSDLTPPEPKPVETVERKRKVLSTNLFHPT